MMAKRDAVFAHIDASFSQLVAEIQRYLRQPGFSHTGEGIRESAELTKQYLQVIGTKDAELVETDGNPVVFGHLRSNRSDAKTLILYSHYDGVPVVPSDWAAPPLEARIIDASDIGVPAHLGKVICARAAFDYRGPLAAFTLTLKAMQEVTGDMPVNVVWAVEGEEEIGAPHLHQFVEKKLDDLAPAHGLWMPGMHQDETGVMQVYRGYKGTIKIELGITGGEWGGTLTGKDIWSANLPLVDAPLWRLIRVLHSLVDDQDRVTIDGLDELVRPYDEEEKAEIATFKERFDEEKVKQSLGIAQFKGGRSGRGLAEDYVMRPMMNVVGIVGGYTGPRVFTTLPMQVAAKLDFRFPPYIKPADIPRLLRAHLDRRGFKEVEIRVFGGYEYSQTSMSDPLYQAAFKACREHHCDYVVWPIKPAVAPFSLFNHPPLSKPVIFVGMGHGAKWHEANEYITVEGIRDFMQYTVTFLEEWAQL